MTTYKPEEIKESVKQRYARAAQEEASCCSPAADSCCEPAEVHITSKAEGAAVVAEGDLGLSCGSPTAFGDISAGDTVLDLGSGAGVDVFRASGPAGPSGRVIGVDMTPDMIELATANAARGGFANVEFRLGELEALPVEDNSVDVALSNCVINLVPDKETAFAELYRVLAPGGRFVISDVVTIGDLDDDVRADLATWAECVSGAIDRNEYLGLIEATGFTDVEVITDHPFEEDRPTQSITVRGFKR